MIGKPILGGVLAGFLLATTGAMAEGALAGGDSPPDGATAFRLSVSLPFSVLAADRVEGMIDGLSVDHPQDLPVSVGLLRRRSELILAEHGKVVSDDLRHGARREGREMAEAEPIDLARIDEQAMIALALPTYLEAENQALTDWGGVIGLSDLDASRYAVLTLSAGLRELLTGDAMGAFDLVARSRDILEASDVGDGAMPMTGYQAQVLSGMGAMTSLAALDRAMDGLGQAMVIGAMTAAEAAAPAYPGS